MEDTISFLFKGVYWIQKKETSSLTAIWFGGEEEWIPNVFTMWLSTSQEVP